MASSTTKLSISRAWRDITISFMSGKHAQILIAVEFCQRRDSRVLTGKRDQLLGKRTCCGDDT